MSETRENERAASHNEEQALLEELFLLFRNQLETLSMTDKVQSNQSLGLISALMKDFSAFRIVEYSTMYRRSNAPKDLRDVKSSGLTIKEYRITLRKD